MTEEKKRKVEAEALNEEAMKGVWVDGIGFRIGSDYVILEGVVTKPRTEKPVIVSRILFPTRVLESLVRGLTQALEKQKELAEKEKVKPSEK